MTNLSSSVVDRARREVVSLQESLRGIGRALDEHAPRRHSPRVSGGDRPPGTGQLGAPTRENVQERLDIFAESLKQLHGSLDELSGQIAAQEREHEQLQGLLRVSHVINATLEIKALLNLVMDTIIHVMGAERGFLLLFGSQGNELEGAVARNMDGSDIQGDYSISRSISAQVASGGAPVLTTNAQRDARFSGHQSIISHQLRSIICVPLRVNDRVTGVIYVDNRFREGVFAERDRDLMAGFANQAAVSIENARLIRDLQAKIREIAAMRSRMANILSSIASGVIALDCQGVISSCNRAAATILSIQEERAIGLRYDQVLGHLQDVNLGKILRATQSEGRRFVGLETKAAREGSSPKSLSLSASPLLDDRGQTVGTAIVLDDLTERRRLEEAERAERKERQRVHDVFQRYVAPAVVDRILSQPAQIALGGHRQEISVLFADIRGFSTYCAAVGPEELVETLNSHLAVAAGAILAEEGTLDKYQGDAVMAVFNAPLPQEDHCLRAVRAAAAMRRALTALHKRLPEESHLHFGIGINVGDAVVGNIGAAKMMNYTVIGDPVNMAKRLQEVAKPGQILLGQRVYEAVQGHIEARPVPETELKGHDQPETVYELQGLADG